MTPLALGLLIGTLSRRIISLAAVLCSLSLYLNSYPDITPDITMLRGIYAILDVSGHELLTASEDVEASNAANTKTLKKEPIAVHCSRPLCFYLKLASDSIPLICLSISVTAVLGQDFPLCQIPTNCHAYFSRQCH